MLKNLLKTYISTAVYIILKIILNFLFVKTILNFFGSNFNGYRASVLSVLGYLNILESGVGAATLYRIISTIKRKAI